MSPAIETVQHASDVVVQALVRMGLVAPGATPAMTPMTGGVSSDIWRVELADRVVCVKRALPQLRVNATWLAPVERSHHEWAWYQLVDARLPGRCPRPIARDEVSDLFAMEFLPPERYVLWKTALLAGEIDPKFGGKVGAVIGRIHAITADDPEVAAAFATDACFHSLRLEPYLEATARAHPDVASIVLELLRVTADTRRVLVHGDASPKNVLIGDAGPVLLDAECAWYGDPAFDLAFCLNHLLLKCLVRRDRIDALAATFSALMDAYRTEVTWEPPATVVARAARLIPALFLARVDGKSPVEYLREPQSRGSVRTVAKRWLRDPTEDPGCLLSDWKKELRR